MSIETTGGTPVIITQDDNKIYLTGDSNVVVTSTGSPGVPGPPGTGGGAETYVAAVAIGGQRVVATTSDNEVEPATSSDLTQVNRVIGVTKTSAAMGNNVEVITLGTLEEASFSFTPDLPIYVSGVAGVITQTPPTSGYSAIIGHAVTATKIHIDIKSPIIF